MAKHKLIWDRYEPTMCGQIFDHKRNAYVKQYTNKGGYKVSNVSLNGRWMQVYVHRWICGYFKHNQTNEGTVNHKDGNKTNNSISNLEWLTLADNLRHAYKTGLKDNNHSKKKVIDAETGVEYNSVGEAAKALCLSKNTLYKYLSGNRENKTTLKYG